MVRSNGLALLALSWSGAASAQAIPNGGFELLDADWTESSLYCWDRALDDEGPICEPTYGYFVYDGTHARDQWAGLLTGYNYGVDSESAVTSSPFRVTHQTLSWAKYDLLTGGTGTYGELEVLGEGISVGDPVLGPASVDLFTNWELDLSGACTAEIQVRVSSADQEVWLDDFALGGAACPELVDGDGDGACPQGIDLDGDGTCVGAGEPTYGTSSDCDDADLAVGACLSMDHSGWATAGSDFTATVTGAPPGETVHLIASEAEGSSCPPILGGGCMDVADPLIHLGSGVADATGTAEITVPLRMRTEPYRRWYLQASTLTATRTAVGEVWILPPDHGPQPEEGGTVNGDMEAYRLGWPAESATYFDWYFGAWWPCPAPSWTTLLARGTYALRLNETAEPECDGEAIGWPFLVTHRTLAWAQQDPVTVSVYDIANDAGVLTSRAGPVLADDGFDELAADMQPHCGEVRYLRVRGGGYLDDVRLTGPVCAIYADRDGDGTCPSGVDLDGDGFCVSAGEPDPPVYGTDVPLEALLLDFEDTNPADEVITGAEADPLTTYGDQSALVISDVYEHTWPSNAVVTHDQVAFRATDRGEGDWVYVELQLGLRDSFGADLASALVELPGGPGDWSQHHLDTSAVCGATADVVWMGITQPNPGWEETLGALGDWGRYAHADDILVDEVGFAGAPCAIFVDGDGDGLCSEGVDGDGDGLCVGAGEPTPGAVQDVDDPSVAP